MLSSNIVDVLQSSLTTENVGQFGGDSGGIDQLSEGLRNGGRQSRMFLYFAAAMCVLLFVVFLVLVVLNHQDQALLLTFSGVLGTSVVGLIVLMLRLSQSAVQSGMLISFASALPQDQIKPVMLEILRQSGAPVPGKKGSS